MQKAHAAWATAAALRCFERARRVVLAFSDYAMTVARKDIRLVFPTPVFRFDLEAGTAAAIDAAFLAALGESIDLAAVPEHGLYQTQTDLHLSPRFERFREAAMNAVRSASIACGWQDADYAMTGLWLNASGRRVAHRSHFHPNNIFSGVYYVRVAEGGDQITFEDPRPQAPMTRIPGKAGTFMYDSYAERVRNGALVLFPSWLRHYVPANDSAIVRISAAFNFMVRGFAERHAAPEWNGNIRI